LANWAIEITKDICLIQDSDSSELGKAYDAYPQAKEPPSIIQGDCLSSMTFFHGKHFTDWAQQWVNYWTKGDGIFVASAMEDVGIYQSLEQLDTLGRADLSRLILLRSASNFTLPPKGISPSDYLCDDAHNHFSGTTIALENVYRVGNQISESLIDNWGTYKKTPPVNQ
jgi:purine nucleoside permease